MYCTVDDVSRLLPPTVSIGNKNIGTPTIGTTQMQKNQLTPDDVNYFIKYASQEVDARLRSFYLCPLRRIKTYETEVLNNVTSGTNVIVRVHDSGSFIKGDLVRLQEQFGYENCIVADIPDLSTVVLSSVISSYGENTVIGSLRYPDPIPLMVARMALSYAFDRQFTSEQVTDVSNYGKNQRDMAMNAIDSIITGVALLSGQEWTGRRFIRLPLHDASKAPVDDVQFGREKGN